MALPIYHDQKGLKAFSPKAFPGLCWRTRSKPPKIICTIFSTFSTELDKLFTFDKNIIISTNYIDRSLSPAKTQSLFIMIPVMVLWLIHLFYLLCYFGTLIVSIKAKQRLTGFSLRVSGQAHGASKRAFRQQVCKCLYLKDFNDAAPLSPNPLRSLCSRRANRVELRRKSRGISYTALCGRFLTAR